MKLFLFFSLITQGGKSQFAFKKPKPKDKFLISQVQSWSRAFNWNSHQSTLILPLS